MAFRTQKISQMTPKGSDLEATDLLEVSTIESGSYVTRSITGQEIIDAAVGNVDWGDIGGTLSDQTDLNTALSGKVPTTRTLTINGTTQDLSADRTFTISTGITIGTTAITSGTVGRVLFEGTGNVVQESANLFWDNTNGRLGIGTNAPSGKIHVKGSVASEIFKAESTIAALYAQFVSTDGAGEFGIYTDAFYFQPLPSLANGTRFLNGANAIIMQLAQTGNVLINTTTDAGFRLDVNGTARVASTVGQTLIVQSSLDSSFTSIAEFNASALSTSRTGFVAIGRNGATNNQASLGFFYSGNGSNANRLDFGFYGTTPRMAIFAGGNISIGSTTDAGYKLDVNGTARVSDNFTVQKNQNLLTSIDLTNTTSGANSYTQFSAISDVNSGANSFGKYSTLKTAYKIIQPRDSYYYNGSIAGDFAILNDCSSGQIKFAAGGSSTSHMIIKANGRINMSALPTSAAGLSAGDIWNDAGTLKIV